MTWFFSRGWSTNKFTVISTKIPSTKPSRSRRPVEIQKVGCVCCHMYKRTYASLKGHYKRIHIYTFKHGCIPWIDLTSRINNLIAMIDLRNCILSMLCSGVPRTNLLHYSWSLSYQLIETKYLKRFEIWFQWFAAHSLSNIDR